ncbi:MAG: hypothetical protein SVZ03_08705, partial [Spirochaetota bacterium]|nr:hypothetical protein [Spirochaetota bacterium]
EYQALRKEYQALRKEYQALRKEYQALRKEYQALCKEYQALCKEYQALCKEYQALCKDGLSYYILGLYKKSFTCAGSKNTGISNIYIILLILIPAFRFSVTGMKYF